MQECLSMSILYTVVYTAHSSQVNDRGRLRRSPTHKLWNHLLHRSHCTQLIVLDLRPGAGGGTDCAHLPHTSSLVGSASSSSCAGSGALARATACCRPAMIGALSSMSGAGTTSTSSTRGRFLPDVLSDCFRLFLRNSVRFN